MDLKTLMKPSTPKVKVLMWADATLKDMVEMNKASCTEEIDKIVCAVFNLSTSDPKQTVVVELYRNAVLFGKKQNLKREQISTLLSILKRVHQLNIDTLLDNSDQCFNYCSELLLCHSVQRPPFSIGLYNLSQMSEILKYFINTYMRHYALYKYIFTPEIYLDVTLTYPGAQEETDSEKMEGEGEAEGEEEQAKEVDGPLDLQPANRDASEGQQDPGSRGPHIPSDGAKKESLQRLVQQEVRREMQRLTGQLEQRLKESTDQLNTMLGSLEGKK